MEIERHTIKVQAEAPNGGIVLAEIADVACLGCFGVHHPISGWIPTGGGWNPVFDESAFDITHLPTGLHLANAVGQFDTEKSALDFVRELSSAADWTPGATEAYPTSLGKKVQALTRAVRGDHVELRSCGSRRPSSSSPMNEHAARACYED